MFQNLAQLFSQSSTRRSNLLINNFFAFKVNTLYKFSRMWACQSSYNPRDQRVRVAFQMGVYYLQSALAVIVLRNIKKSSQRRRFFSRRGVKITPQGILRFLGLENGIGTYPKARWELVSEDGFNPAELPLNIESISANNQIHQFNPGDHHHNQIHQFNINNKNIQNRN